MAPAAVTIDAGPAVCVRASLEVAAANGFAVLLTPAAVAELVQEHRRLIDKANDQVRHEWAAEVDSLPR